jgi:nucleoside transporter
MAVSSAASGSTAPPLALGVRIQLSLMMFLQFAIWGAWFVVFFPYLQANGFTGAQAGALMGNMALGAILSTMVAGYIADRFISSELLMAACHLLGAGLLYAVAQIQDPGQFNLLFALTLGYALLYNPTLVLANSITFRHVPDGARDFPGIRVLGTIGWIAAGFSIDFFFAGNGKTAADTNGPLLLAAGLSATLGIMSLFLPKTPPTGKADEAIPFVRALGLFKDFSFAVFFVVSLVITIVLAFYYTVTAEFLKSKVEVTNIGSTMLIGQICETIFLPLLPLFLFRLGMKWVLALGMASWGIRYLLFSQAGPEGLGYALAIIGIAFHGLCFDFFFAAGFIHCDNEAPKDIKASAQALFSFLTYGIGMWLGSLLSGKLKDFYTTTADDGRSVTDWQTFWLVPAVGVLICLAVFVVFFRLKPRGAEASPTGSDEPAGNSSTLADAA